jgi:hypothetical protein
MAIQNPGFEDAGASLGEAQHWTLHTVASLERIAGFGPAPHEAWEAFERWFDLLDDFDGLTVAIAFFDPLAEKYEDFEEAWNNDIYLFELPTGQMVTAPFGGDALEDMEDGWSNEPFTTSWAEVAAVTGEFDNEPREDFEERWRSNQSYAWSWAAVTSQTAKFDAGANTNEDFENDWTAASTV